MIHVGDCRDVLPTLPERSVHCVVTSPPYYSLRDYGHPGQIGLEATVDEYVTEMVGVFRLVRRVMRDDATLWLNLGDAFGSKQLLGVPWRVAFALQADGWYLRSDIIWSKPNPMPESVTDRPTKAHEYLFLLTKKERYYYDADAVREGLSGLQQDASSDGVLRTQEPGQPIKSMSRVLGRSGAGMAQASWLDGEDARGEPAISGDSERPDHTATSGPLREEADGHRDVSPERGGTEGQSALLGIAEGEGSRGSVLPRASDVDGWPLDVDRPGVGAHQGESVEPVHLLRGNEALDDGSRDSREQGRDPHEGERGWGVPSLQQPKARSAHMAATPRNDGERWREVDGGVAARGTGRNLRSVWNIATAPYKGAHFAVFPEALVEPCIKAGTSERGVCPECGAPWERDIEKGELVSSYVGTNNPDWHEPDAKYVSVEHDREQRRNTDGVTFNATSGWKHLPRRERTTTGWRPTCAHDAAPVPATVLDPFAGSGTVGRVAEKLSRRSILIELNPDYVKQAEVRTMQAALML